MQLNPHYAELNESYLFSTIAHKVADYQKAHPDADLIRLGIGDVTLPLARPVVDAMHKAVEEQGHKETFHGYIPREQGYEFLREAIRKYYAQRGVTLDLSEIFISDGAKSDLGNLLDLFSADNTVLVPDPVYPVYVDDNVMAGRKVLYLAAGDLARIKVFAITLPETPKSSTTHPDLPDDLLPAALTNSGAVSGIQVLPNGRLLFTRNSLTAPNDVFVLRNLTEHVSSDAIKDIKVEQLTKFTADALKGKTLNPGEDFYFDGAEHKIHGWIVKPPGFKEGAKKKYPIMFLIHGGPQGAWEDQWSTRWNPQGKCDFEKLTF